MRSLILLPLLCLALTLNGCPATTGISGGTAGITATKAGASTLIATGDLIKKTPAVADALFAAGTIDANQYNQIAAAYTQAQAAYIIAVDATQAAVEAGNAPDGTQAALAALDQLNKSAGDLQKLLAACQGGK